ncbi:monovalent cation/H+ antiporter subunit D family protein [Bogoriella caseilytica]|uniref:Multisubunit sodium/proton antiporter MrpD subunit n=1 Tax=Bogoriella caseilytica TaxID=56055 RepID=A0A3N2BAD7_9MICO|nr:monovalent cation/H+ antiporter subunit D family protein [Bogoriella caseilytica]ROR72226.1 multisubunit sodium/proton antiporter MrpD subunit [Bogoriella caseilytica]
MIGMLIPMLVAVPLMGAALTAFGRDGTRWPVRSAMVLLGLNLAASAYLVFLTQDGEVYAHGLGGWIPGIAIPLVVDMFSALVLTVAAILALVCSWYALASGTGRVRLYGPLVLAMTAGVNGALMTGDLFNLFVFVEVMLLPSYGLLVLARRGQGSLRAVTGSRLYVTFNLFVSTVLLAGVGLVYGAAGTVNLAELAGMASEDSVVAAGVGLVIAALSMKAAVVPVHGWLARVYPSTSPAVTALFSGLHTKVAIYAIYRIYSVAFDGDESYLWIGLVLFSATMAIGVIGAVGESTARSILTFHMVSQIGYVLVGVALFTGAGLTAGIFYLLHNMIVKASLFLSAGAVEEHYGTGRLDALRGLVRREPLLAVAFTMAALSLAGLPPFSGFLAKLTLLVASFEAGQIAVAVVAIAVSLITLMSMLKIINAVFFAPPKHFDSPDEALSGAEGAERAERVAVLEARKTRVPVKLALPAMALAVISLILGLGGELLLGLSATAAEGLLDTSSYVEAVMGS